MWRTGTKVGRTIYLDDKLVGMMDTPELADRAVLALNGGPTEEVVQILRDMDRDVIRFGWYDPARQEDGELEQMIRPHIRRLKDLMPSLKK